MTCETSRAPLQEPQEADPQTMPSPQLQLNPLTFPQHDKTIINAGAVVTCLSGNASLSVPGSTSVTV